MQGSCLCGAVVYAIDGLDGPVQHCHCRTCQKAQAAPFAPTARVLRQHFRWLQGEALLASYESSPGKQRCFCPRCGTHLVAMREGQPHVILRVVTLDDAPDVSAAAHIWTSHDLPWLAYGDELPSCPEFPPAS